MSDHPAFAHLVGKRVFSVCGPGQYPNERGCYRAGNVTAIEASEWGARAVILWDGDEPEAKREARRAPNDFRPASAGTFGIGLYVAD